MPPGAVFIFHAIQYTRFADWTTAMWVGNRVGALDRRALLFAANYIPTLTPALQAGSVPSGGEHSSIGVHPPVILAFAARGTTLSFASHWVTAAQCGTRGIHTLTRHFTCRAAALEAGVSPGCELLSILIHFTLIFTLLTSWATVSGMMYGVATSQGRTADG